MKIKSLGAMCLATAFMFSTACSSSTKAEQPQEQSNPNGEWVQVNPAEITINPIDMFHDAMALTMGDTIHANAMAIGWGSIGVLWQKPVVTVYVSESRYSKEMMDKAQYFTISAFDEADRDKLMYLGRNSGRDTQDKIKDAGLTIEFTENGTPRISEGKLCYECRIIYRAPFEKDSIDQSVNFYDRENAPGIHSLYIGEIVNVWKRD